MSQPKQQEKSKSSSKKSFKNVPEDFLKDVYIEPHNFIWPENPDHGEYVNEQLKHDLFFDAYTKIQDVEGRYLVGDNDYFKLKKILALPDIPLYNKFLLYFIKDQRLASEDWTIDLNGKQESHYIVHSFQSENDRFYTRVFPRQFTRFLYMTWHTWDWY